MNYPGDKTFGDLMNNNYLECNAAPGFSQQSLQGSDGLFRDKTFGDFITKITLNVTLPQASLTNCCRDLMNCSGDKTFGVLM